MNFPKIQKCKCPPLVPALHDISKLWKNEKVLVRVHQGTMEKNMMLEMGSLRYHGKETSSLVGIEEGIMENERHGNREGFTKVPVPGRDAPSYTTRANVNQI
jgi:predicted metal-binding protein